MLTKCVGCGSRLETLHETVRDPLTNEVFAILQCPLCRLGHTDPHPKNLASYYPPDYYGNRHGLTLNHCLKRRLKLVTLATTAAHRPALLDIGCGDGSFLLAARENGWAVAGTELAPQTARAKGLDVREHIDDLASGASFDCITMWHTLEHMHDPLGMLSRIKSLLKPTGRLIVAVPDFGGWQARLFRNRWLHLDVPRHLYHFDNESLTHCLSAAGFSIDRRWHQEFEYDLLGWVQSSLNWLLPKPNLFFNALTGKTSESAPLLTTTAIITGAILSILLTPAVLAGTVAHQGGTLIVSARPNYEE